MTGFMPGPHCGRGTLDIIWSCLSTTLLAIWVSLHLRVDSPHAKKVPATMVLKKLWKEIFEFKVFDPSNTSWPLSWRKIFQALRAIFLPEMFVTDAVFDLCEARRLKVILAKSDIKGFESFSLRQAFFVRIVGVYYEDDCDDRLRPLNRRFLEEFVRAGRLEFEDLPTDEQIADRSKSDRLLKSISLIQTLWFIANVIYRLCVGQQVSLLEDLTAAYAFCGLIQLAAWFRCPQDVCQPFIVHLRPKSSTPQQASLQRRDTPIWHEDCVFTYPLICCVVFTCSAAIFSGVHLAAWNYSFASVAEMWLWRSCSLAMTPLLLMSCGLNGLHNHIIIGIYISILFVVYILSRLAIIAIAFASFRKAPVGIYDDASWTDIIPHI